LILYYTATQKTKVFAEALGEVLGWPLRELESNLNKKKGIAFLFHSLYLAVIGKGYPVSNMPEAINQEEIYICSPVWGGQLAGPAWYFLNQFDLTNKKVNLLLTCASAHQSEKYRQKALESLGLVNCIPGKVLVFITTKNPPEKDVIINQMREMLR
jgi:hypothetical protein